MTLYPQGMLTAIYWLHMLATVAWVGGQAALVLMVLPAARKTLTSEVYSTFLGQINRRLQFVGWISLIVLVGTGMFQMSASPSYQGFLSITNTWAVAILIKHLVIGLLVGLSAYSTWGMAPALQRLSLLRSRGKGSDVEFAALQKKEEWLIRVNLGITIVVLLLTAWARSAV